MSADNITEPVKPANDGTETHTVLSIGSREYQLSPQVSITDAIWMLRLLGLGTSVSTSNYDATNGRMVRSVGTREIVALQMVPATESEVAK